MRALILLTAVAALAACSEAKTVPEAVNAEPAMETQAASWKLEAGTYEFTREDGTRGVNTVAADGTYSIAYTGGKTETGTWAEENGKTCLTSSGDAENKRCYVFTTPDAQGNLTGTSEEVGVVTSRKTS
ncbi:MAG: hypothetical protein K2Y17_00080 [Qipengyuania sp.]|jgi:hypothetical protein|nr:hypothetical protein [Qipengyuania sp.]